MSAGQSSRYAALTLAGALLGLPGAAAQALFVDGADTFDGTSLDTATWNTSVAGTGTTFAQNRALTIHASGAGSPFPWGGYTTNSAMVPVGGSAWVQVTVNALTPNSVISAGLVLDTDGHGVNSYLHDGLGLSLVASYDSHNLFTGVVGGEVSRSNNIQTSTGLFPITASPPLGRTLILQIERLTASNVRMSYFSEDGFAPDGKMAISLLESGTTSSFTSSANMYASLQSHGTDATFASITVNQPLGLGQTEVAVPEPASLALCGAGMAGLLARRRRLR